MRKPILISIVLGMLLASMDNTIMNATLPQIVKILGGYQYYAWAIASYAIVSTATAPIYGRISDFYGRKRTFMTAVFIFTVGSFLCSLSSNMFQLVIYRGIQGLGAGGVIPVTTIIAGDLFPVEERGKIQALFSTMWGISAVLAPVIGSIILERFSWEWIFYINVPLGIIILVLASFYREVYTPHKGQVDYWGAAIFTVSIALLLAPTITTWHVVLFIAGGIVLFACFIWQELRHPFPVVPLNLFNGKVVRAINLNSFLTCVALFGASTFVPFFLQQVHGLSVFVSGITLLGSSLGWMATAVPAGKWVVRYGYRRPLLIGNLLLVAAGAMFAFLGESTGFLYTFAAQTVSGCAFGLIMTVTVIASQEFVPGHMRGISTSLQMFSRNIGGVVGITVMGALLVRAEGVLKGVQHLFLFGFAMSIVALLSSLLMPGTQKAAE